ncbi:MAG: glycosyltransferase, partial [Muribaculaceae bacterium]|nr:glycosyltransferase [Muribaculaceae bacterium]
MKATIIILTYNQVATIGRAIESVLRQECRYPFELLIAD